MFNKKGKQNITKEFRLFTLPTLNGHLKTVSVSVCANTLPHYSEFNKQTLTSVRGRSQEVETAYLRE